DSETGRRYGLGRALRNGGGPARSNGARAGIQSASARERARAGAGEGAAAAVPRLRPTLLSEHLSRDPEIGFVHPATLRRWMIEEGLWKAAAQGKRHRKRRERRAAVGELVLMDTSVHPWLEERFGQEIVLIALIDDATSRLRAGFFSRDTGAANRQMIVEYLQAQGRMGALYTARPSHLTANWRAKQRKEADEPEALTLIRRALDALEIELILALSPQAKGRVERLFGTPAGSAGEGAARGGDRHDRGGEPIRDDVLLPFWEERFTVEPREATDAHRPLPGDIDLQRLFEETDERVIREDFTEPRMPGSRVTIEHRLDGSVRYARQRVFRIGFRSRTPKRKPGEHTSSPGLGRCRTAGVRPGGA
ncbi:MAG: hypothetical protein KY467_09785, partial [Gemmatimonadetes bacterium]|nr:hypothetical protein [Gemmatimonadota bacterium]